MIEKKINRYSNVELVDVIKNSTNRVFIKKAAFELDSRNLTPEKLKIVNSDYDKYKKFQNDRKDMPLTTEEWFSFFFLPFITPRPQWRNSDHFTESEFDRFNKYGFNRKSKEASKIQLLGTVFWVLLIIVLALVQRLYGN